MDTADKKTWLEEQGKYKASTHTFDLWLTKGTGLLFLHNPEDPDTLYRRVKDDLYDRITAMEFGE